MMTLFSTHARPIIELCSCVWHTSYIGICAYCQSSISGPSMSQGWAVQTMDLISRFSTNTYSIQGSILHADLIQYWKLFHGKCSIYASDMFTSSSQYGTRGHRFKVTLEPKLMPDAGHLVCVLLMVGMSSQTMQLSLISMCLKFYQLIVQVMFCSHIRCENPVLT